MRRVLSFAIKAAVSIVLFYFAVDWSNIGTLGERLGRVKFGWLALMVALLAAQVVLIGLRWRRIVLLCGYELPVWAALRLSFIATFFNQTLPSSVGGDAVRVWMLARQGAGWGVAAYSVVIDRLVGVLVLSLIVIACLPWTTALITDPIGRGALIVIGFGSLVPIVAFVALGWLRPAFLQSWAVTRHLTAAASAAAALVASARDGVVVIMLSLLVHLLTALAAWSAAKSVAAPLDYLQALFLVLPVLLVTVVPISIAGWGVRENAMGIAFTYAGLAQSDGLLVSLLFGIGLFVVGISGGLIWVGSADRAKISSLEPQGGGEKQPL